MTGGKKIKETQEIMSDKEDLQQQGVFFSLMEVAQGANWTGSRLQASCAASVGAPFLICSPNNANAEHIFSWWPVIPHCNEAASPSKVVALRQAVARLLAHSAPHKSRDN